MKNTLIIAFMLFAVTLTAGWKYSVVNVTTYEHAKTDTVNKVATFSLAYKSDYDSIYVMQDVIQGAMTVTSAIVEYQSTLGTTVARDTISSITNINARIKGFNVKLTKYFPRAIKCNISVLYRHQGKSMGKLYYILY